MRKVATPRFQVEGAGRSVLQRRMSATTIVAGVGVVVTALRWELTLNVTLGTVMALALAPVWFPRLIRYRGALLISLVAIACLPVGAWLTAVSSDERSTSDRLLVGTSILLLNVILGTGMLLWARTRMSGASVAILYGVGLLLAVPGSGRLSEDPWRFGFSVPLTVLLLAIAWRSGRRWLEIVTALLLAAVTAASGGRSLFAILALAAILSSWQVPPRILNVGVSRVRTLAFLAAALAALYTLGQSLTLEGYLGQSAQERTQQQVSTAGSVLAGGRPEMGATFALVGHEPLGFGAGARLNATDLLVAKSGMADLGYDPNNRYVETYMFGAGIELHSYLADLWSDFGVVGVVLGALIVWQIARHLSGALAHRAASALIVYVGVQTAWNLFFSPRYGSIPLLVLTLGLMIPLRDTSYVEPDTEETGSVAASEAEGRLYSE